MPKLIDKLTKHKKIIDFLVKKSIIDGKFDAKKSQRDLLCDFYCLIININYIIKFRPKSLFFINMVLLNLPSFLKLKKILLLLQQPYQ